MRPERAARLRAAYLDDLDEQLLALNAELLALERDPAEREPLRALFRAAHTLKGAARAASLEAVERLCHAMEEVLDRARAGALELTPGHFGLLFGAADALAEAGARIRAAAEPEAAGLDTVADALRHGELHDLPGDRGQGTGDRGQQAGIAADPGSVAVDPNLGDRNPADRDPSDRGGIDPNPVPVSFDPVDVDLHLTTAIDSHPPAPAPETVAAPSPALAAPAADGRVRVEAEKLDALLAAVEQLLLVGARLDARMPEVRDLGDRAARSAGRSGGTRVANGAVQGAPGGAETDELRALAGEVEGISRAFGAEVRGLGRVTAELAERARRLRMRPFAEAFEGLPRVVRDVAAASGKEARAVLVGADVEADRAVVDAVREALLHLARNAVDHGVEAPEERVRAGKPRAGTVTAAAALRGEHVAVTLSDDGRGLDLAALRETLVRRGRPVPADERELARALFESGVSTRGQTTEISGRGVGLDAARAALAKVRGTVAVDWTPGAGTRFTLECPLTLATLRALLVRVGGHPLAVPTANVDGLSRVFPADLKRAEDREVVATADGPVPVVPLARVLGPPLAESPVAGALTLVHLRAGGLRLAVAVDEAMAEAELVVRSLPRGRSALPLLGGAAILGTGEVALVMDAAAVVAAGLAARGGAAMHRAEEKAEAGRKRILVVDDSLTTRTLEQGTLEAAGYDVDTAVDGEDGWRILQERGADLVVTDVEMPRMDGIELCRSIRESRRFADLPVILVTSLDAPEHRQRGLEAGADAYIGKASFDQDGLIETVRRLLG
jgi:two-component system chemotaxis sensor kinase CheA